ncbi:ABC transporter ATP-binding protein [Taklimakanibacter lacteus]|uniref:ABC transporter ATP-binding protein n=1 Tax=Taklimakanibacter lacteus TaxID=2268456 RepID=UPI000E66B004
MDISLRAVTKTFGQVVAVDSVELDVPASTLICFLGPSGCGKTTLLRLIAGLETADSGSLLFRGKSLAGVPERERNFGMVFQSYSLFPNLTVEENVAYGPRCRRWPAADIDARVRELLAMVDVENQRSKYPHMLSGGQQQRVALARALAPKPHVLLLDEPLSALDAKVRRTLRSEIRRLQQSLGITSIMVTHDQEEALTMADQIVVMNEGRIVQEGPPAEIYSRPATPFVAGFVGSMNFLDVAIIGENRFNFVGHELTIDRSGIRTPLRGKAVIAIRPEAVEIARPAEKDRRRKSGNVLDAQVDWIEFLGGKCLLTLAPLSCPSQKISAEVPARTVHDLKLSVGSRISLILPPDAFNVYPA